MTTTINGGMHLLQQSSPFDFLPSATHSHSRSASVCSSSSSNNHHNPHDSLDARPHSSQGSCLLPAQTVVPTMPSASDIYRSPYLQRPNSASNPHTTNSAHAPSHTRHSSASSTSYSTDLVSPADSPPNHNLSNPALGLGLGVGNHHLGGIGPFIGGGGGGLKPSHLGMGGGGVRQTHIRTARNASNPYAHRAGGDAESVYSSSSETEDMAMFFNHSPPDYQGLYVPPQHHHQHHQQHPQQQQQQPQSSQDAFHAAGQFGRMSLQADQQLEQLAANVRAATTTSASDRAKQIFVQAWCVLSFFFTFIFSLFFHPISCCWRFAGV